MTLTTWPRDQPCSAFTLCRFLYFYTEHDGNPALVTLHFKAPEGVYVWPIVEISPDVMRDLVKEPHSGPGTHYTS
ncbi:hypothetical protein [Aeromicrobium piscarium]|uniref:Uncharacterized protein n=1 Tax=Aeromicrobium piscarium TaxID=2590901 RepID=A0A554RV75_9ACTN|nr:hypothetical protein [Aeromicrobium piscarium]TSD58011.1 hypothetical protein FNM00_15270 [Aeromicrobium piscarium]